MARMRRLSMRVPLRLRLATLRRLWLRRLWLLLAVGSLPHLLEGVLPFKSRVRQKPQPALRGWPGPYCASVPTERGATSIRPDAWRESIAFD